MSDFFETGTGGGLSDWMDGYEPGTGLGAAFGPGGGGSGGGRGDGGSGGGRGGAGGAEPAYPARFGWAPALVPLPRRAPDELF